MRKVTYICIALTLAGNCLGEEVVPPIAPKTASASTTSQKFINSLRTASPAGIVAFCGNFVRERAEKKLSPDAVVQLLADRDVRFACYAYACFTPLRRIASLPALQDAAFVSWLYDHPEALEGLAIANTISETSLDVLYKLWVVEEFKPTPLQLKMTVGCALIADVVPYDTLAEKYMFFKDSLAQGKLFESFSALEPWEHAFVFRGKETIEELQWAQDFSMKRKNFKAENASSVACGFIPYRSQNKEGISIHKGNAFYDNKPITIPLYVEYGGVCGAVSKGACGFLRSRGVPAFPVGQPGHCAFLYRQPNGYWAIGNNIHGWTWTTGSLAAIWKGHVKHIYSFSQYRQRENRSESDLCYFVAQCLGKPEAVDFWLQEATSLNYKNDQAWRQWLPLQLKNADDKKRNNLVSLVRTTQASDPFAQEELLDLIYQGRVKKEDRYRVCSYYLGQNAAKDTLDIFYKRLWKLAIDDITTLKPLLTYGVAQRGTFVKSWTKVTADNDKSPKMRTQTVGVLQSIIPHVTDHDVVAGQLVDMYGVLIKQWGDKELTKDAKKFILKTLSNVKDEAVRNKLVKLGLDLSNQSGDEKTATLLEEMKGKK